MIIMKVYRSLLLLIIALPQIVMGRDFSPLEFGLNEAITDVQRYEVLLRTHEAAVSSGCGITYEGIQRICIEIPHSAKSIPLASHTNFCGIELVVRNTQKKFTLFSAENPLTEIKASKKNITSGRFLSKKQLRTGLKILVISDETPWVERRKGYNYGATREDLLLIKNGRACNKVIASYNDYESNPRCYYADVSNQVFLMENLNFVRTDDSKYITRLFELKNLNNVTLKNISIHTPAKTDLYGDAAITIINSANVIMQDVTIDGTYSRTDKFGYGIAMNNVYNAYFKRLTSNNNWGVFGNNNLNHVVLDECDINRFDIHSYGRDVYCYHTKFRDKYNQFSSFYGELVYEDCIFDESIPVIFETSYSSYTPFDLTIKNCEIKIRDTAPYLIYAGYLNQQMGKQRTVLKETSWPNISIINTTITLPDGMNEMPLFYVNGDVSEEAGYIDKITLQSVKIKSMSDGINPSIFFSNRKVETKKRVNVEISYSDIKELSFK